MQDVFLRLWRRPSAFDASRGDLGTYLRMMARSRAIDLLREGQTRGRASDRLKLVVSSDAGRAPTTSRARRWSATSTARSCGPR